MSSLVDMHVHLFTLPFEFELTDLSLLDNLTIEALMIKQAKLLLQRANVKIICNCQKNSLTEAIPAQMLGIKYGVKVLPGLETTLRINGHIFGDFIAIDFKEDDVGMNEIFGPRDISRSQRNRFLHQVKTIKDVFGIDLNQDKSIFWHSIEAGCYGSEKILYYLLLHYDYYAKLKSVILSLTVQDSLFSVQEYLNKQYGGGRIFPLKYLLIKLLYFNYFALGKVGYFALKKDHMDLAVVSNLIHNAGGKIYFSPESAIKKFADKEAILFSLLSQPEFIDGIFTHHTAGFAEYTGIRPSIMRGVLQKVPWWGKMRGSEDQGMGITNIGDVPFTQTEFKKEWSKTRM